MDSLKELIDACLCEPRFEQGRQEVKAETWCNIGTGAGRVADYLIQKQDEFTRVKKGEAKCL